MTYLNKNADSNNPDCLLTGLPFLSIIIPVKPGGYVKALEAIKELDYPLDRFEVLIAEGSQPSRQRNEAAKKASGEILYFLDDDSLPDQANLNLLIAHYEDKAVAAAGGPSVTPATDTLVQRCFAALFCSPFGGGGVRNRYRRHGIARETSESELILCNLSFRSDVYRKMGGLNEELYPNEENELMSRIQSAGMKLIYDPGAFVLRSQREGINAFIRQMLNYGRGRMEQTIISPSSASLVHFIPALFVFYLISLPVISYSIYKLPLILYILLAPIFSLKPSLGAGKSSAEKIGMSVFVFVLFPVLHIAYGLGLVYGLKRLFCKKEKRKCSDINIIKPDLFGSAAK